MTSAIAGAAHGPGVGPRDPGPGKDGGMEHVRGIGGYFGKPQIRRP